MLPPSIELSLRDRAINAFKTGNVPRAYGLYQAHLLSAPSDELETALQNLRWDKKRIVPRLGYSFAVGLIVNNTSKQESLKPIGTDLEGLRSSGGGAGGAGGGAGRPGFGGFGAPGGGSTASASLPVLPAKELSDAAGKYASKFIEAFGKEHSEGKWSEAFREYEFGSSLTLPTTLTGLASGFAGSGNAGTGTAPGLSSSGGPPAGYGGGGPPPGYGGGGPPAGYAGGGGPPPGYGGGQGGPPAGYSGGGGPPPGYGGGGGPPPGYGGGQGGPPAGYSGGGGGGPPAGYGGGQSGPPAGYSGGGTGGPPAGYGGSGAPPAGGNPPAGQGGGNAGGGNMQDNVNYVAPQDDADSLIGGAGSSFGSNSNANTATQPGRPGFGAPGVPGSSGSGFGSNQAPALDPALAKDLQLPSDTIPLSSGLTYIGKGDNVGELTKRALEQNYDVLIVFEVDVSFLRVNQTIKNDCRIRAVDLRADKEAKEKIIVSTQLNNRDIAVDKEGDARIEKAVDNFIKKLSETYALENLPNFKAESITGRRLKDLVNDKTRSKLDLLCEIELYAYRGLMDNTLKLAAFDRIAGSDGKELVNSQPEDRIPILEKMIGNQFD
jgi:hypothetical protein